MLDLLITFLSMGANGLQGLWRDRKALFESFKTDLDACAKKHGLRLLEPKANKISICVDLTNLVSGDQNLKEASGEKDEGFVIVGEKQKENIKRLNALGAKLLNHR